MIKRITCILAAFIMAVTVFSVTTVPVSAASTVTYQQATATAFGLARERTGKYFIWVDNYYDDYGGVRSYLTRSYDMPSAGPGPTFKILRQFTSYDNVMDTTFVSNGYYVYYAVVNRTNCTGTIYRTNVKTGGCKKIKFVDGLHQVEGYYNGRIYYTVDTNPNDFCLDSVNLRSCSIKTKKTRLEKRNFDPTSSYGKYFTGTYLRYDVSNVMQYRYNASSRKTLKLQSAHTSVITNDGIYYLKLNGWGDDYIITKSNWSGKNKKTIKYIYDVYPEFFGKRRAVFENVYQDEGFARGVVYKTKKVYGMIW